MQFPLTSHLSHLTLSTSTINRSFSLMVITISRQYGAGGSEVARLVAARLGWSVVDNESIDRVAERAKLSPVDVARQEQGPASSNAGSHACSLIAGAGGSRAGSARCRETSPAWFESPRRW